MKNQKMILNTLMLSTLVLAPTISSGNTFAEESTNSTTSEMLTVLSSSTKVGETSETVVAPEIASSSVVASSSTSETMTSASTSETSIPAEGNEDAVKAERDKVVSLIAEAKTYIDYTKYEKKVVDNLKKSVDMVEGHLAKDQSIFDLSTWKKNYTIISANLELVKQAPLDQIDTSSTGSATSETNSTTSDTSSTTETSGLLKNNVKIEAKDQTMYVGQKLTEDMIIGWATFKNLEEDDIYGYTVDKIIEVSIDSSVLLETGKYTITYFVLDPNADEDENILDEKSITLTVLGREKNPFIPKVLTPDTKKPEKIINTSNKITPATTRSLKSTKKLPQTGEKENNTMTIVLGTGLIATVYFISRKKKETLI